VQSPHRHSLTAYVAADRHLRACGGRGAKTLTQMAAQLGTTKNTVRRWLRRDHWDLWMEHRASVEEIWEELKRERAYQTSAPPCVLFDLQGLPDIEDEAATA
jgi:hypothetical protein